MYTSTFTNMFYGTFPVRPPDDDTPSSGSDKATTAAARVSVSGKKDIDPRPRTSMKLVTLLPEEKVLGIHLIGQLLILCSLSYDMICVIRYA